MPDPDCLAKSRAQAVSLLIAVAALLGAVRAWPQTNSPDGSDPAAEKHACADNLNRLYEAIHAFEAEHHDLPNWLSDLFPEYISDTNLLICPAARRTGKQESPPLADPKITSSYLFEFCPVPLGGSSPKVASRTRREWKRRQMGLVGSMVPLVRCRQHDVVLNLAFDGRIYESQSLWETLLTNRVTAAELTAARLFANEPGGNPAAKPQSSTARPSSPGGEMPKPFVPPRDPAARSELLDLSNFYNASFTNSWHGNAGNDLATFPAGLPTLAGIEFDARGIVQLGSKSPTASKFPAQAKGIAVHERCQRLYFLHAAGFGSVSDEGKQIGSISIHFATNQMSSEVPIIYGRDVRNWHELPGELPAPAELRVVWNGQNAVSKRAGRSLRLFLTCWTNPAPEMEIQSLDYVSSMAVPAPFLLAITAMKAEPPPPILAQVAAPKAATPTDALQGSATPSPRTAFSSSTLVWLIAAAFALSFVAIILSLVTRRRPAAGLAGRALLPVSAGPAGQNSVYTMTVARHATGSGSSSSETSSLSSPGGAPGPETPDDREQQLWRQRALAAEERADQAVAMARKHLEPGLSRWLKSKLVGKLVAYRTSLLQAQEMAASKVLAVDERLSKIEQQIQEQNKVYQQHIEELTRELLAAKEENRELIRVQIAQVKAEMEAARARLLAQTEDDPE